MTTTETNDKGRYWDDQLSKATEVYEALAKLHKDVLRVTQTAKGYEPDERDGEERNDRYASISCLRMASRSLQHAGQYWLNIVQTLEACLDYPTLTKPFWEVQP